MITLDIDSGTGARRVPLLRYLDAAAEERVQADAYAWIKAVRHLRVGGEPLRTRFTFRGDSLWWFAELYLHKTQAVLNVTRVIAAFDALLEAERPLTVTFVKGPFAGAVAQAAQLRKVRYRGPRWPKSSAAALLRLHARSAALAWGARMSRLRASPLPAERARVAAFVHRAFWRAGLRDGSAESYIGPVLEQLETRLPAGALRCVGVGPRTNFRARRWWDPLLRRSDSGIVPIERYAAPPALAASHTVYRDRHATRRLMWDSAELREHAVIRGCDCWPVVREQLAGIALLQFPWSARAMDEAAAALRALEPEVALTYAEAGGWGRALALECRRHGVPLAGLQHGFIYRHWLNYRHEADEALPDPRNAADPGFPFPALTLLFDEQAARHLIANGRFPEDRLAVTGSPRLDELKAAVAALDPSAIARTREEAGAGADQALVLFAAKEREARGVLPALVEAARAMPEVQLVIKPHPAEIPRVYADAVGNAANIRIVSSTAPLPPLLAAAGALVTVNSTLAIDALSFGIPTIVLGLPNNLTPFVDLGVMRGARSAAEIRAALAQVLYDQEFRSRMRRGFVAAGDGRAAARSAEAILALTKRTV